jgi:hypothetical protein
MLLVLQIVLTIAAWLRGWKGWALLPLGIAVGVGFLIGLYMGESGVSDDIFYMVSLMIDLACIGVLIGMVIKPRRKTQGL